MLRVGLPLNLHAWEKRGEQRSRRRDEWSWASCLEWFKTFAWWTSVSWNWKLALFLLFLRRCHPSLHATDWCSKNNLVSRIDHYLDCCKETPPYQCFRVCTLPWAVCVLLMTSQTGLSHTGCTSALRGNRSIFPCCSIAVIQQERLESNSWGGLWFPAAVLHARQLSNVNSGRCGDGRWVGWSLSKWGTKEDLLLWAATKALHHWRTRLLLPTDMTSQPPTRHPPKSLKGPFCFTTTKRWSGSRILHPHTDNTSMALLKQQQETSRLTATLIPYMCVISAHVCLCVQLACQIATVMLCKA